MDTKMNINLDSAKDTLCKNILIYGYCKFENKGCAFRHSLKNGGKSTSAGGEQTPAENVNGTNKVAGSISAPGSSGIKEKKRFNFNTPSFQPSVGGLSNKFSALSPKLNDIATFIPEDQSTNTANNTNDTNNTGTSFNSTSTSTSTPTNTATAATNPVTPKPVGDKKFNPSVTAFTPSFDQPAIQTPPVNPYAAPASSRSMNNLPGNDMYFSGTNGNYPLNYHLYAPAPPPRLAIPLPGHQVISTNMFIANDLREAIQKKNEDTTFTLGRTNLPDNVNVYHTLVPLDMEYKSSVWQVNSGVYKVFSNVDGNAYALRKIDHEQIINIDNKLPFKSVQKWKSITNSNIVQLHDCFTSIAFGGNSSQLCVVYDYYPGACTLSDQHFSRKLGGKVEPVTEELIWCYIVQITNALTDIHSKGVFARSALDLTKIIVTNKSRIKLSSVGISDILGYETHIDPQDLQSQDFKRFASIVSDLVMLLVPMNMRYDINEEGVQKLKSFQQYVNPELVQVMEYLDSESPDLGFLTQTYLASKMIKIIDSLQDSRDYVENQLSSELENGRLFRLISKINFVLDNNNFTWQENEKIYLIKMFHDYIFHQVDDQNKPVVDLSRALVKLNKLDCGVDERFMLITGNDKLSILVSYKEIRDVIDSAFRDLTK